MMCGVRTPHIIQDFDGETLRPGRLSTAVGHEVAGARGPSNNRPVAGYIGWGDEAPWTRLPPADEAPDLEWTLYYQEDVVTRRQALAGLSIEGLRHLVDSG